MLLPAHGHECLDSRGFSVIAHDIAKDLNEGRLSAAAGTVNEQERFLARIAPEHIAGPLLQIVRHRGVTLGRALDYLVPERMLAGFRVDRRSHRDVVLTPRR